MSTHFYRSFSLAVYCLKLWKKRFSVLNDITPATCRSGAATVEVSTRESVSSQTLLTSGCATSTMHFTARHGQTLNMSIVDFSSDSSLDSNSCLNYLQVKDTESGSSLPVCSGSVRERHILQSTGHEIEATFQLRDPNKQRFLLRFEGSS